jgi:hypothetical protein
MADIGNENYTKILSKQHYKNMLSNTLKVWTFRSYETWIPRNSASMRSLDRRFEIYMKYIFVEVEDWEPLPLGWWTEDVNIVLALKGT